MSVNNPLLQSYDLPPFSTIRAEHVLPAIETILADNRAAMPDADPSQWVAPAALADVIAFLGSDAARAIHGASIPVTGLV